MRSSLNRPKSKHRDLINLIVLTIAILGPFLTVNAQSKKPLIDLFYEALSLTETDSLFRESGDFYELSLENYALEEISPAAIIKKFPEAKKYLVNDSIMIIKPYFEIQGFIEDFSKADPKITIKNFQFESDALINLNLYGKLKEEVFNASDLKFEYCHFKKELLIWFSNFSMTFAHNTIDRLQVINETVVSPRIAIHKNTIHVLGMWTAKPREVIIANNNLGLVEIDRTSARKLLFLNNTITVPKTIKKEWYSTVRAGKISKLVYSGVLNRDSANEYRRLQGNVLFQISSDERYISTLEISGNRFLDPSHKTAVIFNQLSQNMVVTNNVFETPVIMRPVVSNRFVMEQNLFETINMEASMPNTPQNYVVVDWNDLKGKLNWQESEGTTPYYGLSKEELADKTRFFNLIAGYSRLLEVYKSYGNLDDANDVFLDMKELHLKRYEYLYQTEGGTTNFFQLNLNRLLKVYTRHGTDPAQAMTASLWIIIFFSVIYFFFPSDWDVSSKSKLMSDFKSFTEKNEKGYFKPFFSLLTGVLSSFFNAITLSVNSFVTLGFGTIPTTGLAKYICIFQGFLGWFLLSIFIVALINQILI